MSPPLRPDPWASFGRELENEDSAAVALFVQCCRQSPALRHWLFHEFARAASVRNGFAKVLHADASGETPLPSSVAELVGENRALREEQQRLKNALPQFARPYGGLSWAEMEKLVRRYQAGSIKLGAFLLAQAWREQAGKPSLAVTRATAAFVADVIASKEPAMLRELARALQFLDECADPRSRRSALGYQDRWKVHALFFMLRNPSAAYRTRDIRAHLATHGLEIGTKDVRRFCSRHGIKRDVRAGRPRTKQVDASRPA